MTRYTLSPGWSAMLGNLSVTFDRCKIQNCAVGVKSGPELDFQKKGRLTRYVPAQAVGGGHGGPGTVHQTKLWGRLCPPYA
jgi:hypothetical protein